jgi:hypothetical protein
MKSLHYLHSHNGQADGDNEVVVAEQEMMMRIGE